MPALKLFVSHSSRLDEVPDRYTDKDANWRLLREVIDGLKARYGTAIQILVDKDGLIPGDDWNRELNLWLAECHAAVILFSRRALKLSDWVKKEAAILGWRAALDPGFTLIPVTLEGESTAEDLAAGYFGALDIGRIQCVHASQTAEAILTGVVRQLGEPEDLAPRHATTPLERLQGGIAKLLADAATADSIAAALEAIGTKATSDRASNRDRYAELLARELLRTSLDEADVCFHAFQRSVGLLAPRLPHARARELFAALRSLWVHPGAAAFLATARERGSALVLAAQLILQADPDLGTHAYTLERYIERAWSGSQPYKLVPVSGRATADQVRAEIRDSFRKLPPGVPTAFNALRDQQIRRDPRTIILAVDCRPDGGGLPDPLQRQALAQLSDDYDKLVLIFAMQPNEEPLPDGLIPVRPMLDPSYEATAFLAEGFAANHLKDLYPDSADREKKRP